MIELFFWPTPNGYKPLIALEELGLPYRIQPVDINRGAQFTDTFLAVNPNGKVPAIRDDDLDGGAGDGSDSLTVFESGAVLVYLAEKAGRLQPRDVRGRFEVQQWLHWQMAGVGPNFGQAGHFYIYANEDVPYAKARFLAESQRLLQVMERRLADRDYLAGDYSIADIACYPWVRLHGSVPLSLESCPRVARWLDAIANRPAVMRAYEVGAPVSAGSTLDAQARRILFGSGRD